MKLAAVAPALFVLVSLCGSPVPAPGGSVTGLAFYDANRNGIHDSCDLPLPHVAVSATAANGKTAQATAGDDGAFHIENVPSGDDRLTLVPGDSFLWPVTTTADDGTPGLSVHVDELQDTPGVEIGSASRTAFAADRVSISGIIFEDKNANGVVDKDECGIPYAAVEQVQIGQTQTSPLRRDGTYELLDLTSPKPVSVTVNPASSGNGFGAMTDWTPTNASSPDRASPCGPSAQPVQRYGPLIYEANVGFTHQRNVGTVSGSVFDDTNGNGVRDEGEAGVSNASISLQALDSNCFGFVQSGYPSTPGDGHFDIGSVAPGVYTITLQYAPPDAAGLLAPAWDPGMTITVLGHNTTSLNLPTHLQQGATVRITTFDDANGNGSWDSDEQAVAGMNVCLLTPNGGGVDSTGGISPDQLDIPPMKQGYPYGPQSCSQIAADGSAVTGPVLAGEYLLNLGPLYSGAPFTEAPPRDLTLTEGQELDLDIPVAIVPPEAQVVPEGGGEPLDFTTCYSDPAWVQPPFQDLSGTPMAYDGWPSADEARAMYSHGIYINSGSQAWYVWSVIAGLSDWFTNPPAGCSPGGMTPFLIVDLAGYEPLSAVTSGSVDQITLARHDTGLYVTQLSDIQDGQQHWYLFVDESDRPLARCGSFSGQCEWFN